MDERHWVNDDGNKGGAKNHKSSDYRVLGLFWLTNPAASAGEAFPASAKPLIERLVATLFEASGCATLSGVFLNKFTPRRKSGK